jgi:hypothetical protein
MVKTRIRTDFVYLFVYAFLLFTKSYGKSFFILQDWNSYFVLFVMNYSIINDFLKNWYL